jgi:hypothetical protein
MRNSRFLNIYGWILVGLFVGCLYTLYIVAKIESQSVFINYFGVVVSIYYLATGIGILARKLWGYYLLKSFLYILLMGFPIGTFISIKSLRFMKKGLTRKEFIT